MQFNNRNILTVNINAYIVIIVQSLIILGNNHIYYNSDMPIILIITMDLKYFSLSVIIHET